MESELGIELGTLIGKATVLPNRPNANMQRLQLDLCLCPHYLMLLIVCQRPLVNIVELTGATLRQRAEICNPAGQKRDRRQMVQMLRAMSEQMDTSPPGSE